MPSRPVTPPWKRKKPAGKATPIKLTEASKAAARARALRAGRRYPNLVDNMWAAQRQAGTRPPSTARKQPVAK